MLHKMTMLLPMTTEQIKDVTVKSIKCTKQVFIYQYGFQKQNLFTCLGKTFFIEYTMQFACTIRLK